MTRLAVLLLLFPSAAAQEEKESAKSKVVVLRGAKLYTVSGAPIENAVLVIENGKIAAVGADVKPPDGAEVVDLAGKVVIPGLVDAASRLFVGSTDLLSGGSAEQDIYDLVDPYDEDHKESLQAGVTTVCLVPYARGAVNGLAVILRPGVDRGKWILKRQACLRLSLGTGGSEFSSVVQRYESYRMLKGVLDGAKQYKETWEKYKKELAEYEQKKKKWDAQQKKKPKKDPPKEEKKDEGKKADEELKEEPKKPTKPRLDPKNEIFVKALEQKIPVRIEAHTADMIERAIELAKEYGLKAVIDGGSEASVCAGALAKEKIPVVFGPVFRYDMRRVDYLKHDPEGPALLAKAGVSVAIASHPDPAAGHHGGGASRFLLESAARCAGHGLPRDAALRAVTLEPARTLGIEASVGSIEKGKVADLVVLSGEPFEPGSRVERTMVDGAWVYQRKIE